MPISTVRFSSSYDRAIHAGLLQQAIFGLLSVLMLDNGRTARLCALAMIGYWIFALIALFRRPQTPNPRDLAFLRWGFLPLFALVGLLAGALGRAGP